MKAGNIRKGFIIFFCIVICILTVQITAFADTGPKPSVRVKFVNMSDKLCYATLLSENESTGPASAWDGDTSELEYDEEDPGSQYAVWKAFVTYNDTDGYYFLQQSWKVNETKSLAWTYYPPDNFKILLYWPETKTFAVSEICNRYAFDSYYTAVLDGEIIASAVYDEELSSDIQMETYRSYDYRQEIIDLIIRIIITVIIEMIIALLFGFRRKKQLRVLLIVNILTQIILNILLNVISYNSGKSSIIVYYVILEILIVAVEGVLYCRYLKKASERQRTNGYYILYSLIANTISFVAGLGISLLFPKIF